MDIDREWETVNEIMDDADRADSWFEYFLEKMNNASVWTRVFLVVFVSSVLVLGAALVIVWLMMNEWYILGTLTICGSISAFIASFAAVVEWDMSRI